MLSHILVVICNFLQRVETNRVNKSLFIWS